MNYAEKFIGPSADETKPHVLGYTTPRATATSLLHDLWNGATSAARKFGIDLNGKPVSAAYTAGDLLYAATGVIAGVRRIDGLAKGTADQLLRMNAAATAPEWATTLAGLTLTNPTINAAVLSGTLTGTPTWASTQTMNVTGNVSGSSGSCTGNAATVTGLSVTAGQTLTVTTGGTLGSAAYTESTAYATTGHNHAGVYDVAGAAAAITLAGLGGITKASADGWYDALGAAAAVQSNLGTHAGLTTTAHGLGASAFHADAFFALAGHNHTGVYEAAGAIATHAALTTGVHGLAITAGQTLTVTSGGTLGSAAYTASTAYDASGAAATVAGNLSTHAGLTTTAHGLGASAFHADAYFALAGHAHSGTYEPVLGNPAVTGYVLSSTSGGVRSWVSASTPAAHALIDTVGHTVSGLTTGNFLKATGTTTYGFAAHGLTYTDVGADAAGTAHTEAAAHVATHESTYSHANFATAYGWGNHASAGYLTSITAHNLLSATHGDTTAGTVARGDLVVGQGASAKWVRMGLGTTGKFLKSDGTDAVWAVHGLTYTDVGACSTSDSRLSDSRPASDVYSWAKAASKPSYTYSEVGADASGAAAAVTPTTLGLVIGTNVQAYNSNLTAINQALTTSSSPSFTALSCATLQSGSATALLLKYNTTTKVTVGSGSTVFANQYAPTPYDLSDAAPIALDWNNGNVQRMTLTASRTWTFANPVAGARYVIILTQGGSGSYTVTWPTIKWAGGTAPTLTTTVGKKDVITLVYDGTDYIGGVLSNA